MANINKSFNFRNGVQVDNDNFVVNANGLVGIGTSIPREFLDVYGTAKITGLVTTTNLAVSGVSTFYSDLKVGSGITLSPSTGAVSAIAFYGNGLTLSNIVGYSTEAWIVNVARTGLSTTLNVGIGTTNPQYSFQVGQNPSSGNGFSVDGLTGNVKTAGIITANSFDGSGAPLTALNATNIASGTLNNARLPSNINVSGIITASTKFSGDLTGTVTGNVIGIASTALSLSGTPNIIVGFATATQFIGNVTGIASTALSLSGSPSITVTNISAGIITAVNLVSGISSVGISTVSTRLYAESIGVGTNSPSSDIHIRRTSTSKLQVTSDSAEAIVVVGRSTTLTESNGALRHGNTSGLQRYSSTKSLDIINYDTGNINSYLQLGSTGINTGSFHWIYGQTTPNAPIMTLTYDGKLGIGVTLPTNNLHIVGTSTVTSNAYVGNSLYVGNNLNVSGILSLVNPLTGNVTGNVTGNLTGNVNATTGISTFNRINASVSNIQNLGIGGSAVTYPFEVGSGTEKIVMNGTAIGIGTTSILENIGLDASNVVALAQGVGIGTTNPKCYADFADAGTGSPDDPGKRFMLPPKVSSADRVGLTTVEGGVIYNTTVRRLELYLGDDRGWVGIATIV